MLRRYPIHIGLVILVALAAFFLMRVHVAGGAKLAAHSESEGHRLAEAWCTPCHAIEPHMAGMSNQASSFDAIAKRHGTTALFAEGLSEDQPPEHAESGYSARTGRRYRELYPQSEDQH